MAQNVFEQLDNEYNAGHPPEAAPQAPGQQISPQQGQVPTQVNPFEQADQEYQQQQDNPGFLQQADNAVRRVANAITGGGADSIAAYLASKTGVGGSPTTEGQQAQTDQAAQQLGPVATGAADLTGGVMQGLMVPGSMMATVPKAMATGAAMGLGNTVAQEGFRTGELPSIQNMAIGTMVGAGSGYLGGKLGELFQKPRLDPTASKNVNLLNDNGIDVSAGQATRSQAMLQREAAAGGPEFATRQTQQYSKWVAKQAGIDAPDGHIDPGVLDQHIRSVGAQMDHMNSVDMTDPTAVRTAIAGPNPANNTAPVTNNVLGQIVDIKNSFRRSNVPVPDIITRTQNTLANAFRNGRLNAKDLQDMSSNLSAEAKAASGGAAVKIGKVQDLVDTIRENYLQQTNPQLVGQWKSLNDQYAKLTTVRKALQQPTTGPYNGDLTIVSPQNMATTLRGKLGEGWQTKSDFAPVTTAALATFKQFPSVGNSAAIAGRNLGRQIAHTATFGGAGYTAGHSLGGPVLGTLGAVIGSEVGPRVEAAISRRLALTPVAGMPENAIQNYGRIGVTAGGVGAQMNPFLNAEIQQKQGQQ